MSRIHILQIAHDHPDWTAGGTEILAHDLTRALDGREGVSARFLAAATALQGPQQQPGSLSAHGQDFVLRTGSYDRFSMVRLDGTEWLAGLGRVLRTVRPDIVHLHGLDRIGAEVIPAVRRLARKARIVLTLHDYQLICPNDGLMLTVPEGVRCPTARPDRCHRCLPEISTARHALRKAHLMAILNLVDIFIAPSRFLRDRFIDWGLDPARIRLVPNAVATTGDRVTQVPRARRNRFAFFGNIAAHKGPLVLLDAAARLRDENLSITLHGGMRWASPEFRSAFEAALQAAKPIAQYLGPYDRSEVRQLMVMADWVVVPSLWWENAPLVILEAQAASRPVICSGTGGMAEMVTPGITGLHVPPGDSAALAEMMREVTADPELWARLAAWAPKSGAFDAFVSQHLEIYSGLCKRVLA